MKIILTMSIFLALLIGCKKADEIDTMPPPPPQGIRTISLDNAIEIRWLPSQAHDVKGYNVWVSNKYDGRYSLIASTTTTSLVDYGAINGVTYYYALSAYDFSGNESKLTKDVVYDTPRPEGFGVVIYDTAAVRYTSAYSFSQYKTLSYFDINADFFLIKMNGYLYLKVIYDTDIQDMGYTSSLDEISASPQNGWSLAKAAEAIKGHTYVVWTVDNNYGKIRITDIGNSWIKFDWAYQTAKGNPELRILKSN